MVGAVWYRARAELRRRWRSTLVLGVLAGVAGGAVVAGVAGARRTSTAMDRFVEHHRPAHVFVEDETGDLDEAAVRSLPQVVSVSRGAYVLMAPSGADGEPVPGAAGTVNPFLVIPVSGEASNRPLVVDGRLPDPEEPLETIVDEELAEARGLAPGDTFRMHGYAPVQLQDIRGDATPEGPAMDLRVTGVMRTPDDVVPRPTGQDVVYMGSQDLVLTPAWYERFGGEVAAFGPEGTLELRLRDGPAAIDAVTEEIRAVAGGGSVLLDTNSEASMARRASDRSIRFAVGGIAAATALAAVAGLALVGQALARTLALEAGDGPVLRALGIGTGPRTAVAALRVLAVAVPAGVVAVAVAVGLSPAFPIGLARRAEIDPGVSVDLPALLLGGAGVVVAVAVVGVFAGWRLARGAVRTRPGRPSRVARRLGDVGAPPPLVAGVRLALERGRGRGAVAGLALAALVVVGAATFASSLAHLVDTPAMQGWNWDVVVGDAEDSSIEDRAPLLEENPHVGGWSGRMPPFAARVAGEEVALEAVGRGDGPTAAAVEGRAPTAPGEVALGEDTLDELGVGIGDRVEVSFDTVTDLGHQVRGGGSATVVGTVLFNDAEEEQTELGTGALMTLDGVEALGAEPFVARFLVDYAPGVDEDEAFRSLRDDFGRTVLRPVNAVDVENLRRVAGMPLVLAAVVGALALAVLAHALVTTLRRRRRELAVLRTLGFLRRQLVGAVVAFAATTVVLAVVLGAPVGVGLGRWSWRLVASSMGSPAPPVVPVLVVALVAPLTLLAAVALAAGPARSAAATEPALVLRSE